MVNSMCNEFTMIYTKMFIYKIAQCTDEVVIIYVTSPRGTGSRHKGVRHL